MKRTRKAKSTVPVGVLVRETGLSRQSVWRKRRQGKSDAEIRAEARAWHQARAIRVRPALLADTPVKVNGAANGHAVEIPPYTLSQARKEDSLAKLRELEYRQRSGELIRAIDAEALVVGALLWFTEERRQLPNRLGEQLHMVTGADAKRILEVQLDHHLAEFGRRIRRTEDAHALHAAWLAFVEWRHEQTGVKPS